MDQLEGKLTSDEVAVKLNEQADVLQKYIDAKLNSAISRQRPTARRMKITSSMREDALKMERLQNILRALAKAHSSNNIIRFPHLEDIRNKKQIQSLLQLEYIQKYNRDIDWYIDHDKDTLERMSIFSKHDWENAYKQLEDLLKEFSDVKESNKQIEAENAIEYLELEALAELELLKMELEFKKSKKGLSGKQKSNPYPIEEEFLLGNVNEKTKKRKSSDNEVGIKNVPEVKLTFRKNENFPTAKIVKSEDAVDFIRKLFEKDTIQLQEQFMVLYLNRSNHVIGYHLLSKGGIAGTVADLRLVFSAAILSLSSAIILSHNHPSGNLKPSDADIKLTRRFKETGVIMEIPVLDSIILTEESFYSFADDGMI